MPSHHARVRVSHLVGDFHTLRNGPGLYTVISLPKSFPIYTVIEMLDSREQHGEEQKVRVGALVSPPTRSDSHLHLTVGRLWASA